MNPQKKRRQDSEKQQLILQRNSQLHGVLLAALLAVVLLVFGLVNLLHTKRDFSENENRKLQAYPALTAASVLDGSFMSKLQSAFADQFFARDHWISAKLRIDQLLGQKESNGVYLCQDNYLIEIPEAPDPAVLDRTLSAMKEFAAKHDDLRMTAMIVPNASLVMREYLPANAPAHNQQEDLFTVNQALSPCMQYADVTLALKAHVRDGVFYRTDHHWTSLGAYYGYRTIADTMNLEAKDISEMSDTTVNSDFYGTLYSKVPLFWLKGDEIHTYVSDNGVNVKAFNGKDWSDSKLYFDENLNIKDKYTYFLGQNEPLIVINAENTDKPKLLIIRDSYSDSLAPFLTQNFSEIHLLDPRYYKLSVADYVADNNIDSVIICYSLSNFSEDKNLSLVLSR